jgi:hypothetical protein
LLVASSTLHNGTQSPICFKASYLMIKTKQIYVTMSVHGIDVYVES